MGEYSNAIVDLDKAIELTEPVCGLGRTCPRNPHLYSKRGFAYFSLGQLQRALDDYDEAIFIWNSTDDSSFDIAEAYHNRSNIFTALGRINEANNDKLLACMREGSPYPCPTATLVPIEHSYISMPCNLIVSDIAAYALENAYEYGKGSWNLSVYERNQDPNVGCPARVGDWGTFNAIFKTGEWNLHLGWPIQGISGIQQDIFDYPRCGAYGDSPFCSPREIQENPQYPFNIIGLLTDGVVKVMAPVSGEYGRDLRFPQFLYEMTLSEKTLTELHDSGMDGEELARHYYKNYEAEWKNWFKGEDSEQVEKIKSAVQ